MSKPLDSIVLKVSPGDKTFIEINTLAAGGGDLGYRGVLDAGLQYQTRFDFIFSPADGSGDKTDAVFGTGGTEPLYGGKTREQVGQTDQYPDPGTGPNPGYSLGTLFNVGGKSWTWDLSCRAAYNFKDLPDGLLTVQATLDGKKSQSEVLAISKGRCTGKV